MDDFPDEGEPVPRSSKWMKGDGWKETMPNEWKNKKNKKKEKER